jgi:hypothetical protein
VRLRLSHPVVAARTCDFCLKWMFDPETGQLVLNKCTGEPLRRPVGVSPPCFSCPKCSSASASRTPETGRESDLTPRNQRTLELYYENLAVPGPADNVMRRNFGIIHRILSEHDRLVQQALLNKPLQL